jgi:UDP-glucose 4-epimerase
VRTPVYVRDHLAAPRLAKAYAEYVTDALGSETRMSVARPSGWIASQGEFAQRVAAEAGRRLGLACAVELGPQPVLEEPLVRVNDQPGWAADWEEDAFWDGYVDWYAELRRQGRLD